MAHNRIRVAFLPLTLCAAILIFFPQSARAVLHLQQKAVYGFPVRGVLDIVQIEPEGAGAHRLATLTADYLIGLQWSPERSAYDQTFFVQRVAGYRMTLADVNGDGRNDIVVFDGYPSEGVAAYDSMTGALLKTFTLRERIQFSGDVVVSKDIDGLPGDEMIVSDTSGTSAYKNGDVLLWHSQAKGSIVKASRGAPLHDQIFVSTGSDVIVLDTRTGQETRRFPISCQQAFVGQTDSDANPEIACRTIADVQLFDGVTGALQWTRPYPAYTLRSAVIFDTNGDGVEDVLVRSEGDIYKESVQLLNGTTGALLGTTRVFDDQGVVIGITSGCEPPRLLVGENSASSAGDQLSLLDATTFETKSTFTVDSYGTTGCAIADFDGDGQNELAVAHDGKVSMLKMEPLVTGNSVSFGDECCTFRGMAAAQLDHAATVDYVLGGTCGAYLGCITAWDPAKASPQWKATMDDGEVPRCAVIADVDGDGAADVLSASFAVHGGAKGTFVYAFRGRDGKPLWKSINVPGSIGRVRVADVEGKGTREVLALSSTVGIVRMNLSNGAVKGFYEFTGGAAFATFNLAGDPRAKVVAATANRLFILDDGQVKAEVTGADASLISEIEVADIDGDGVPEILVAQGSASTRLQVRSIDTLALLWTSETFPVLYNFGQVEQIAVGDVDNDGMPEVVFLSSLTARVFKADGVPVATVLPRFEASARLTADIRVHACCAVADLHWTHARPGTAAPLQYRIYRAGLAGEPEVLLGTTSRNEFLDKSGGAGAGYRYSVVVVDAAGRAAPEKLTAEVKGSLCHRPAGKR